MIVKGQEVYSQIVGAIAIDSPAESDIIVSFPFKQSAEFRGTIESVSDDGTVHLVVATDSLISAAFDANGSVPTHYVVIETGTQMGTHVGIGLNTGSQISLIDGNSAGLQNGDEIAVYPHWTLGSAFPNGVANHEETEPGLRKVEVIVPEGVSPEGNMIPEGVFYFYDGAWRGVGAGLDTNLDSEVLEPNRAFVIRNNDTAAKKALVYGEVIDAPIAISVSESDVFTADNFVGLNRPLGIAVKDLGLTIGGVFEETTDPGNKKDRLLVYSSGAGKNKHLTPAGTYYYFNGAWRELATGDATDKGADVIDPGMGVAIRKFKVDSNPQNSNWVNEWVLPTTPPL
ncbi:MAG: TIGR02597 family protein [Opitutaceae bacterium]|nr:TIGR02597 family protein [Opitutaceae bacterium]